MPSPIFHTAAATACAIAVSKTPERGAKALRSDLAFGAVLVFAANCPDLDLVPAMILGLPPMTYHHGFTHSFFFTIALAFALSAIPLKDRRWSARAGPLLVASVSHVLLDLLNSDRFAQCLTSDCGMPLLWPFTSRRWNAVYPLFGNLELPGGFFTWFTPLNLEHLAVEGGGAVALVVATLVVKLAVSGRLTARADAPEEPT